MSNVGSVTISSPSTANSSSSSAPGTTGISGLTQQDFLELMVAEFQSSDPLASDSGGGGGSDSGSADYVNQLMSMTNLTTMQSVSSQQGLQLAQTLPGQTVTITKPDNTTVTGVISGTTISNGTVSVTVDGVSYPTTEISSLVPTASTNTSTTNTSS